MLAKRDRLLVPEASKEKILKVRQFPHLTVKILKPLVLLPRARVGVVVSRGAARNAVIRNRLRRSIYNTAQQFIASLPPLDYLCIVRAGFAGPNRCLMSRAAESAFQQLAQSR